MDHTKTLDEAVAHIESKFECVEGQPINRCETGDEYVTILSSGLKQEGETYPGWYESEELAIGAWVDAVFSYASSRAGTLYWRRRPEIKTYPLDAKDRTHSLPAYTVYSRLVISDGTQTEEAN